MDSPFATIWMDLVGIMLSEISKRKTNTWNLKQKKRKNETETEKEKKLVVVKRQGWRSGEGIK